MARYFCCLVGWGIDGLSARVLVCCLVTIEEALDCADDAVETADEGLDEGLDEDAADEEDDPGTGCLTGCFTCFLFTVCAGSGSLTGCFGFFSTVAVCVVLCQTLPRDSPMLIVQ